MSWPLVASLGVHAAALASLRPAQEFSRSLADAWAGTGVEVELVESSDVAAGAPADEAADAEAGTVPAPSEPEPAAPTPESAEPSAPESEPAVPTKAARPPAARPTPSAAHASAPSATPPRAAASSQPQSLSPHSSASAGAGTDTPNSGANAGAGSSAGSFGATGLPAGVRDLGTAFTRAIPPAASRDAAFVSSAPGDLGTIRIRLALGEEGRISSTTVVRRPGEEVPASLERLATRVVALLGGGQFALRDRVGRAGEQTLEL
ncbi:MAG TPA: hypothetical protein VLC09_13150, partial [Polyangiaceae bacterium]|nr:hypothetical protein [Polyangiaceae bacterium]